MRPCTGVDGVIPPLCNWQQLNDGTYSLADVELFNTTIREEYEAAIAARESNG